MIVMIIVIINVKKNTDKIIEDRSIIISENLLVKALTTQCLIKTIVY